MFSAQTNSATNSIHPVQGPGSVAITSHFPPKSHSHRFQVAVGRNAAGARVARSGIANCLLALPAPPLAWPVRQDRGSAVGSAPASGAPEEWNRSPLSTWRTSVCPSHVGTQAAAEKASWAARPSGPLSPERGDELQGTSGTEGFVPIISLKETAVARQAVALKLLCCLPCTFVWRVESFLSVYFFFFFCFSSQQLGMRAFYNKALQTSISTWTPPSVPARCILSKLFLSAPGPLSGRPTFAAPTCAHSHKVLGLMQNLFFWLIESSK